MPVKPDDIKAFRTAFGRNLLAEIARSAAPGAHALLILDGAGWHGSNALVVPDNLSLLTLPPYSPELNPVEKVKNVRTIG